MFKLILFLLLTSSITFAAQVGIVDCNGTNVLLSAAKSRRAFRILNATGATTLNLCFQSACTNISTANTTSAQLTQSNAALFVLTNYNGPIYCAAAISDAISYVEE